MSIRVRCGLCNYQLKENETWEHHKRSHLHQNNLNDPIKLKQIAEEIAEKTIVNKDSIDQILNRIKEIASDR